MRCWIGVAAGMHAAIARRDGFCAFSHGERTAVSKVLPGDRVAYYSPREGMKDGAEIRAFTAIGVVQTGDPVETELMPGAVGWIRKCAWAETHQQADIYPLLDRFSFVKNRSHWGMHFRKSLFEVPASDFAHIAEAMGVSDSDLVSLANKG